MGNRTLSPFRVSQTSFPKSRYSEIQHSLFGALRPGRGSGRAAVSQEPVGACVTAALWVAQRSRCQRGAGSAAGQRVPPLGGAVAERLPLALRVTGGGALFSPLILGESQAAILGGRVSRGKPYSPLLTGSPGGVHHVACCGLLGKRNIPSVKKNVEIVALHAFRVSATNGRPFTWF